jgi:hypothetical protein
MCCGSHLRLRAVGNPPYPKVEGQSEPNKALLVPRPTRNLGMRSNPMQLVVVTQWVRTARGTSHLTHDEPAVQE